jgi:hypothetical protein
MTEHDEPMALAYTPDEIWEDGIRRLKESHPDVWDAWVPGAKQQYLPGPPNV